MIGDELPAPPPSLPLEDRPIEGRANLGQQVRDRAKSLGTVVVSFAARFSRKKMKGY